jgi:type II secretory pathway pseudopilin PulG
MLVVIAIIAILAALLLPVLAGAKKAAQKKQAAMEISQIVGAIQQYDSVYGRFPVSAPAQTQASQNAQAGLNPDVTYGGVIQTPAGNMSVGTYVTANNAFLTNNEVIAILMDLVKFPNDTATVNANHQKNPQQTIFLNAKMSGYDPSKPDPQGGVDITGVYRDPWGNPYVISMDLNYDEQCRDAFYCSNFVSSPTAPATSNPGLNGLISPDTTVGNNFQYQGKVMVWSAGPDKMINPVMHADKDANKDNILNWAQ